MTRVIALNNKSEQEKGVEEDTKCEKGKGREKDIQIQ